MKISRYVVVLLALAATAFAQEVWKIDPSNSAAQFSVRHFGISTVSGGFSRMSGNVLIDDANPSKDQVEATIEVASIDTRVERRDNDLRGPHFFDAEKYPSITFKSTKVESEGAGKLKVTGDLTMRGVTKSVVLQVEGPSAAIKDPMGNLRRGASATTTITRQDFGINADPGVVGDQVTITLDIEMTRPVVK